MYVYFQLEPLLFTVGFYTPNGEWVSETDHGSKEEAADRAHYLNGGKLGTSPTRIELASIMIAQSMLGSGYYNFDQPWELERCVRIAKVVLEEANK